MSHDLLLPGMIAFDAGDELDAGYVGFAVVI